MLVKNANVATKTTIFGSSKKDEDVKRYETPRERKKTETKGIAEKRQGRESGGLNIPHEDRKWIPGTNQFARPSTATMPRFFLGQQYSHPR
jgi:Ni/Co efflux regulator RcnB